MFRVEVQMSGCGSPPGYAGQSTNRSSLWVRSHLGWHEVLTGRSRFVSQEWFDECDSWDEVFTLGLADPLPHWFERVN